jgi:hypothetical protein
MSEFTALKAISVTLKELLEAHITNSSEPELNGVPIDLRSPKEMREDQDTQGISLWLYRVMRNADLINQPLMRPAPDKQLRRSMPVDLYYLVTPIAPKPEDEQALMGRVLQVFNDHPTLSGGVLKNSLAGSSAEFRVSQQSTAMQELTDVWLALHEPYQLSATYVVQAVNIESDLEPLQTIPVVVTETDYNQILKVT